MADLLPKVSERLSAGPGAIKIVKVGDEVISCDDAIGGVKMGKELKDGDFGKAKGFITELIEEVGWRVGQAG